MGSEGRRGGRDGGVGSAGEKRYNVCDEDAWWADWREVVSEKVLGTGKGYVGVDDWMAWAMGPGAETGKRGKVPKPWGMDAC